jgi:hypothetical protein
VGPRLQPHQLSEYQPGVHGEVVPVNRRTGRLDLWLEPAHLARGFTLVERQDERGYCVGYDWVREASIT